MSYGIRRWVAVYFYWSLVVEPCFPYFVSQSKALRPPSCYCFILWIRILLCCCWCFFFFIWIEKTETHWERHRAQPPMPYICASLWSSSSVLCFSDLFNCSNNGRKKNEWTPVSRAYRLENNACKSVVNVRNMCAEVQVHPLAAFAAWLQTT